MFKVSDTLLWELIKSYIRVLLIDWIGIGRSIQTSAQCVLILVLSVIWHKLMFKSRCPQQTAAPTLILSTIKHMYETRHGMKLNKQSIFYYIFSDTLVMMWMPELFYLLVSNNAEERSKRHLGYSNKSSEEQEYVSKRRGNPVISVPVSFFRAKCLKTAFPINYHDCGQSHWSHHIFIMIKKKKKEKKSLCISLSVTFLSSHDFNNSHFL